VEPEDLWCKGSEAALRPIILWSFVIYAAMFKPVQGLPGFNGPKISGWDWWGLFSTSFREYGPCLARGLAWVLYIHSFFLKKSETPPTSTSPPADYCGP
jgi:hypothetical protein